ncbi:MAG TPA: UDP-hexose transferase, partial [Salinarimonas sp.]|nr:UDP-hexose transferase [Salinarimonas sp.]
QIIRRDLFVAAGGFDEGLRYCEDWHFWCLLATRSPFAYRPDLCVMEYRIHASSTMHARVRPFSDFAPALEAIFRDEAVRARVPAGELARLKRAANASLLTYVATEAIRLRDYGSSLRSALRAIAEAPGRAPNVVLRVCGTFARL